MQHFFNCISSLYKQFFIQDKVNIFLTNLMRTKIKLICISTPICGTLFIFHIYIHLYTYGIYIWLSNFIRQLGCAAFSKCYSNSKQCICLDSIFSCGLITTATLVSIYSSRTEFVQLSQNKQQCPRSS